MRILFLLFSLLFASASGFVAWQVLRSEPGPAPSTAEGELPTVRAFGDAGSSSEEVTAPGPGAAGAAPGGDPGAGATSALTPAMRASRRNALAIEHLEAGQLDLAVEGFELCVELVPEEPVFAANLAEALARRAVYRHDELELVEEAIADLERAVELAPEREELVRLLERWRRQAEEEAEFARHETEHFVIRFDYQRDELSEEFYRQGDLEQLLESTYLELGEAFVHFPVERGRGKIEVIVYGKQAFDRVTGLGHWAGGVFDGKVRVPVSSLAPGEKSRLGRVLRHELLHAFAEDVAGSRVPGWLGEGLAQWIERRGGTAARSARASLVGHELFPLSRLQQSLATWEDPAEITRAYAQSLAFTDHLVSSFGERLPFELITSLGGGEPLPDAFRRLTLGRDLDQVLVEFGQGL